MKKRTFLTCLVILTRFAGQSQVAAWDFYGQSFPVTCTATTFNPHLETSGGLNNITRGTGAPASGGVNSFRTTGFQNNGISVGATDYFQITLKTVPGYKLSLSTLDAKFNGTSSFFATPGVTSQFAYSLDGVNFTLIGSPVQSTSLTMAQVNLAGISDLQNVYTETTVTIRYYASGQTTTGGWGFYSGSPGVNGFSAGGTVSDALVTTPSVQSSEITFFNIQQTQMGVSWNPGNGEKRLVKMNTVNSFTDPINGTDPVANTGYAGSGEQVVYNYSGSSIPCITGLTTGTTYWFRVYEYNGSGSLTMFNTATSVNNPQSQATSALLLPPSVSAPTVESVTTNSAMLGGHISSSGGSPVTERGTIWKSSSPVTMNDHQLAEGGADTGYFSHSRTAMPPATHIHFAAYGVNAVGTALSPESSFYTLATEPPSNVTGFSATATGATSIEMAWNPLVAGADGYLIVQKQGAFPSTGIPADAIQYSAGTILGDGIVAANVTAGNTGIQTITGLSPGTAYSFTIFPYAWDGINQQTSNYFTGLPVPLASATTAIPAAMTYHWTGAAGNDWNVPANWSPLRSVPSLNDILVFDAGGAWTIINVPSQTIGQLNILTNTAISLQGAGTLAIAGDSGDDLNVSSGCQLNISGSGAITVSLASGTTGILSGAMTLTGGGHRLLAASANAIIFAPGSVFKAGAGFTGNPFGTVNLNSVVFSSGSAYVCQAGGNPFGAAAPASVVTFQPGSLYRMDAYVVPSFGGRTYGNVEMNYPGTITATGSSAVIIDNFTASQGTFYFNVTGSPGHSIRGNIAVANVATLIFAPSSPGTVTLNGTEPQSISGFGSVMAGPLSTVVISNGPGVTLLMNARLTNVTITAGSLFTIAPNAELTVTGNLVNGAPASGFILEPDASLIHNSTGVAATVKRSFAAATWSDWQDGWHFLSSPVAGQAINEAGGFITSGTGNGFDLLAWSEPDRMWANYKNTTVPPLFSVLNGSGNFEPGRGYLAAYQQTGDKTFTGNLNVEDVMVENLGCTGEPGPGRGWHLLGNPYPCALSWYTGWPVNNIGGIAQTWNEEGMSYTPRNPGEPIPACNGFMVEVMGDQGSSGSLTIPALNRIHDTLGWYKEADLMVIKLLVRNLDHPCFQESQIRFNPLSTKGFDPELDGRFLPGYAPFFYSLCGEEKLAVNSLPSLEKNMAIPILFEKNEGDHFQLEASLTGDFTSMVMLIDKKSGTTQNLDLNPVYRFTAEPGDSPERFAITFNSLGAGESPGKKTTISISGNTLRINHQGTTRLEAFGITGKPVLVRELHGQGPDKVSLDVPAGCYLVRTITGNTIEVSRVFIKPSTN
ncbi:MAG: hypothetical protein ACOYNC_10375 [Bacteroidales bacterium]